MKTNHWYHAFSGVVFISIGLYFLSNPPESLTQSAGAGMQNVLPWVIITWGAFKGVNAYLIYQKKRNA
jgi:hypothetical protein